METRSVADAAIDYVINGLIEGRLQPGDRLPSEQELCTTLSISRNSLREAVKQMVAFGVLQVHRPDGTFIRKEYSQKMLDPVLYSIILKKNNWADFVEMRRVLDIGTLFAVVTSSRPLTHTEEMRERLKEMRELLFQPDPNAEAIMACDAAFHRLIEEELGNEQISTVIDYVTRLTIPSRTETIRKVLREGQMENFVALHEQLLDIVENRRSEDIVSAVSNHYRHWR